MTYIKFLCTLCLFAITGTIYGQINKFDIGIEGGPSLTNIRGNDFIDTNYKSTLSFSSGLFFQYNLNKIFSLRTNISFERKSAGGLSAVVTDIKGNSLGEVDIRQNFDYLTLPILLRATFGQKIKYYVNLGPYIGYLVKQTQTLTGGELSKTKTNITSFSKRFDTGVSTGLGLSIPIKSRFVLSFEIRNNLGLYNTSALPIKNDGSIKMNSTNLLWGLTYKL